MKDMSVTGLPTAGSPVDFVVHSQRNRAVKNRTRALSALLALSATLYAAPAVAIPTEKAAPVLQQAGFRTMTLGAVKVVALTDGTTVRNVDKLVTKIPTADVYTLMAQGYRHTETELSINAFLIDTGKQRFLVDTGAGDLLSKAPQALQHIRDEAGKTIGPYVTSGQARRYMWGGEIVPGISSLPAPGHTPGHSVIVVTSDGQKLLILGDTIHSAEVQFPRPDAAVKLDVYQDGAVQQRMKLLEDAAEGGYWVAFDPVSFPGIGHVRKGPEGHGFVWVPLPFSVQE